MRSVGSHGLDKDLIGEVEGTLDETPIAQRALAQNAVVAASETLASQLPPRYAKFAGIKTLTCTPVAAGGRWFGVIFADQGGGRFEPTASERETMLTFGRLAALAASVERATRQEERTHRLSERVGLVRDIHDRVMQRLFGVTLALGADGALDDEERQTCHDELQKALGELRSALVRPAEAERRPPRTTLRELVGRRAERTPHLAVDWAEGVDVPEALESLSQSVFLETLRNCEKHARATRIEVRVDAPDDAFELEVTNDGTIGSGSGAGAGLGLRLLTLEALQEDALVEFGPLTEGRWHVRMVGPAGGAA